MKKTKIDGLDITLYQETLDNGLEVYMLPYDDKKDYYISYGVRYGSDIVKFKFDGEEYVPPLGIAHYLEHKMFEDESGEDAFTFFAKSGTDANASTSYDNTQYICYGTKNFKANLKHLINFVNSPYFTDENVNKERGIIAEEIKMYNDMPEYKLEMRLRENLFKNNPRKYDIAGSIKEINKITKDDLYKCYNSFYLTNNMFILIVGNFNQKEALDVIKMELGDKSSFKIPKVVFENEPIEVVKKKEILKENIEVPKVGLGIKVNKKNLKLNDIELDLYLNMITTIIFGASSEFRERTRNDKILNDVYSYWESSGPIKTFYLFADSKDIDSLLKEIEYELDNVSIANNSFDRIKKVWIANEIKSIDNIFKVSNIMFDDIISYKKVITDRIDIIKKMNIATVNDLIKKIDFKNRSIVKMTNKSKKEN